MQKCPFNDTYTYLESPISSAFVLSSSILTPLEEKEIQSTLQQFFLERNIYETKTNKDTKK